MNTKAMRTFLGGLLAAMVVSASLATVASAAPQWKFENETLSGSETILGGAEGSAMTVPGLTTTCENFLYNISISNSGGDGVGSLEEVPLFNCTTNTKCTVEAIEAEDLPWPSHLTTVGSKNYIVFEGVHVSILYGGRTCVLNETVVEVEGTAGGLVDNSTETATFNPTTFEATGTELEASGQETEWTGLFPTEAFQWHREQALTAS